ncbi:ATP-binding protein [Streptomyces sp. NPDC052225]|uniref:ATP-binding protein n=1 Tax=Streptomyces sp. NPDC052225 TaxID=3154949 RepID=UPI00342C91A2
MGDGDRRASADQVAATVVNGLDPRGVTDARLFAADYLDTLARRVPPDEPDSRDDALLIVDELVANAVQYAPGPVTLTLRRTFDGLHLTVGDSNPEPPTPRPADPRRGPGNIGWHLVRALARQVHVVPNATGKEIHVFLPW